MAQVLVTEKYVSDIASAIRLKNGKSELYTPSQMASAIQSIVSAGALSIITKSISANGSYSAAEDSADAFSVVIVDVTNSYGAGDEGKVVKSGALVAQSSMLASVNSTYDTTIFDSVVVDVKNSYSAADEGKVVASGALTTQGSLSINVNSIYDTTLISQVDVNVAGGSAVLVSKTIVSNGTYNPVDDNADAYSQVVVNVSGGGGGGDLAKVIARETGSVFDNTVSQIGISAFTDYYGLSSIEMTAVEKISGFAFCSCSNLSYASFPNCSFVGQYGFRFCSRLKEIHLSNGFDTSAHAFEGCKQLSILDFTGVSIIRNGVFSQCGFIDLILPDCGQIDQGGFSSCSLLETLSLNVCTLISDNAFIRCSKLKDVYAPMVSRLGSGAFSGCSALKSITLPECNKLSHNAFNGCSKLESVYLLSTSVATLVENAFTNTPISNSNYLGYFGSVFVPASLIDSYKAANVWSKYADRITEYVEV